MRTSKKFLYSILAISAISLIALSDSSQTTLKDILTSLAPYQTEPAAAMWPHGRSPERFDSSYKQPRITVTFTEKLNRQVGALKDFFAYTENAKLLQEIKWNPNKTPPGYDFYVAENYDGHSRPHLVPVSDQQTCVKCHQNGGPIFEHLSWSEMNERDVNFGDPNVIDKIKAARGGDTKYLGFDISSSGQDLSRNVEGANRLIQAAKACSSVCKDDLTCRKELLNNALTNPVPARHLHSLEVAELLESIDGHDKKFPFSGSKAFQETVQNNWPFDGYAFPDWGLPDLPVRDLNPLLKDFEKIAYSGTNYDSILEAAKKQHIMPADQSKVGQALKELDPRTHRKLIEPIPKKEAAGYLQAVAFECLGFDDLDAKILKSLKKAEIANALNKKEMQDLIKNWPPVHGIVIDTLLKTLGKNSSQVCNCDLREDKIVPPGHQPMTPEKVSAIAAFRDHLIDVEKIRPISSKHFQALCYECHGATATKYPGTPKFNFDNPEAFMSTVITHRSAFIDELQRKDMPFQGASRQPSEALRSDMIKYLQSLAN